MSKRLTEARLAKYARVEAELTAYFAKAAQEQKTTHEKILKYLSERIPAAVAELPNYMYIRLWEFAHGLKTFMETMFTASSIYIPEKDLVVFDVKCKRLKINTLADFESARGPINWPNVQHAGFRWRDTGVVYSSDEQKIGNDHFFVAINGMVSRPKLDLEIGTAVQPRGRD